MRNRVIPVVLAAAVLALAMFELSSIRTVAETQSTFGDANADPAPFNPQMSALMSMLIQPRHAKLGIAGKAENWALAGYYFRELKQGFAVTARAVPRWKGLPVPDLFEVAVAPTFAVLDFAIKAGEPNQFMEAYGKLTTGCNNCHATTDHPFMVIKAPSDTSAYPNQEFQPKR